MAKILCSTGTMIGRPNGRDYRLLGKYASQLHCDGFEFMMYSTWYEEIDELTEYIKGLELYIPVVHVLKSIGEKISIGGQENFEEAYRLFELNCNLAKEIGATKLVMHLWDGKPSDKLFDNNLQAYPVLQGKAEKYGLDLLVENVVCNTKDPLNRMCELVKVYPDVHFVFDTKMAEFHRQMDVLYDADLLDSGCITHYHVNVYLGGYMDWKHLRTLPIGQGQVNFEKFFESVKQTGYQGAFTVEATAFNAEGMVNIAMLNESFERIRRYLRN